MSATAPKTSPAATHDCQVLRSCTARDEQGHGDKPREEVRQETAVPAHREVDEVPGEDGRGVAVQQDVEGHGVGRNRHAAVVERLPRVGERKAGRRPVEGLALAALIAELATRQRVQPEQAHHDQAEADDHQREPPPFAGEKRRGPNRQREENVRRLGKRRDAEQRQGRVVRTRRAQKPFEARVPVRRRGDPFVAPEKERREDERDVEELGREPDEVDRCHRGKEKHRREAGGQTRARSSCRQVSIRERHVERQQQRVKHEEAGRPEQPDERRGKQRIDVRLPVVEAAPRGVRGALHREKGKRGRPAEVDIAAALEEDAVRAGELLPDPNQILALEREVPVAREAVGQAVVGRLVSLEPLRGSRKID